MAGIDDANIATKNSLIIAEKIPSSWLAYIKNSGHQFMVQHPDKMDNMLQTFPYPLQAKTN